MKQTIYTVIVYTEGSEGWHDRCGDYKSGTKSTLNIQYFTDIASAGQFVGEAKFADNDTEFTVLVNGLNEDQEHDFLSKEEQKEIENVCDEIRNISVMTIGKLNKVKLQKDEEARLKKAQEIEALLKRDETLKEQIERAQLAKLQAKYSN